MSSIELRDGVTFTFHAFPAIYDPKRAFKGNKGYRFGMLSKCTYDTLKDAKCEVKRLRSVYKRTGRWKEWLSDPGFLTIQRVEKTTVR